MKSSERTLIDVTKYLYSLQEKQLELMMRHGEDSQEAIQEINRIEKIISKLCQWRVRLVGDALTPSFEGSGSKVVKLKEEE